MSKIDLTVVYDRETNITTQNITMTQACGIIDRLANNTDGYETIGVYISSKEGTRYNNRFHCGCGTHANKTELVKSIDEELSSETMQFPKYARVPKKWKKQWEL